MTTTPGSVLNSRETRVDPHRDRWKMTPAGSSDGSVSSATVVTLLNDTHPDEIERALYEVDHVGQAFDRIDLAVGGDRFDVIHDHCGFTGMAMEV